MNNQEHVMLDLETMSTRPDAAILAIGAVKFDLTGLKDEFYEVVSLKSSMDLGLRIEAHSILWWMQQDDEARNAFKRPVVSLPLALSSFDGFFTIGRDPVIWGNGSDFDNVILANAYRVINKNPPWDYRNNRCYRSARNAYPNVLRQDKGTKHNALDDARNQARHLLSIIRHTDMELN